MRSQFRQLILAVIAASLLPAIAPAQALDEITVTARKEAENLQDVPLAITAIGAEKIDRLGLKDLTTITNQDPSVQFDEGFAPSDTRITIRGLSPTRGRPNAATLVDGIDVTSEAVSNAGGGLLINPRLIDVERIEIVKGPQSALYGRSAFAGAIQYVTKDPGDTLSADVFAEYNSEDAKELRASVSVPISDNFGMLLNGLWWDERGIYRNSATNDYVGGGDGLGGAVTFKWEPTDNVGFKLRTEYTDENFAISPQVLLNQWNKLYDLGDGGNLDGLLGVNGPFNGGSNIAPGSSNCFTQPGQPAPGPIDNPGCQETQNLNNYFAGIAGDAQDLGQYDPTDANQFNQYNKQVVSLYAGKLPNAKNLQVAVSPNYQYGPGAVTPARAVDYDGTVKEVFRTSLVADWDITDDLAFTSYSGFTDASDTTSLDLAKFFVDKCSQDIAALVNQASPLGNPGSYYDDLIAQGLNPARYAPCNPALGPDGINDSPAGFIENSVTETTQLSQEFRLAWQINDEINFTSGILYWRERVNSTTRNSVTVTGGVQCYLNQLGANAPYSDSSQSAGGQALLQLDPIQDRCGTTNLTAAYWLADTYQARVARPDVLKRATDHFSWYGSLEWDLTEKFTVRTEARLTREDNQVTGAVQTPCLNGVAANDPTDPASCSTAPPTDRLVTGAGGQPTGPTSVIICGQTGRCDNVGIAALSGSPYVGLTPESMGINSWWSWGYQAMPGNVASPERSDRFWAPKVTLEYLLAEDVLTYFSWSRGIKPGGFSLLTAGAFGLDANLDGNFDEIAFEPERLDVWELGAKTTLFEGRVRLNGALFFQDFKDKQITVQAVVGNTVGTKVENISGSEIRGLELDASWQITDNWLFSGGYTYLDTEFTDYTIVTRSTGDISRIALGPSNSDCSTIGVIKGTGTNGIPPSYGCQMSFNGNELERAPKHAVVGNLSYTNSLFDTGLSWFGEGNFRYQSSRFVESFNIVEFRAFARTDMRIGINADNWDVQLFVDNVFDDDTIITGGPNPGVPTGSFGFGLSVPPFPPGINAGPKLPSDIYVQLPDPRIAGIRANFRFGN